MTTNNPRTPQPSLYMPNLEEGKPRAAPCFGVGCERHAACARYWDVDGSDPSEKRIATCEVGDDRIKFVQLIPRVSRR